MQNKIDYILQLADNSLLHAHRLGELCGHLPELEIEMAVANIGLDNIGAARSFYQYAATLEGNNKTEDSYPYHRNEREFKNVLLVEMPNGNFAYTMAKCFFFDAYQLLFYTALQKSTDAQLAAIAEKSIKEVKYHYKYSSEWLIRLGNGTAESASKMQEAINEVWQYTGELFIPTALEKEMLQATIAPNIEALKTDWQNNINAIISEANLVLPQNTYMHTGGKTGVHTEKMGYILAEMQHLPKTFVGAEW